MEEKTKKTKEKYVKPECHIQEVRWEKHLLSGSDNRVIFVPEYEGTGTGEIDPDEHIRFGVH